MYYYTIYKITNKLDNKIYIGKHHTEDINDDYFGSGIMLKRAIKKYGIENFTKEILFVFDNETDMNNKEKELVNEDFIARKDVYNLCEGGKGGWSYVNKDIEKHSFDSKRGNIETSKILEEKWGINWASELGKLGGIACRNMNLGIYSEKYKNERKKYFLTNKGNFFGKHHTEETKRHISKINSENCKGNKNSQFGTCWITNGIENKKIKKEDNIPENWYKGRI